MRRVLGWSLGVLVGLLVIGLLAGGWYYSTQLLPAPEPGIPEFDVEVVASDEATGTLGLATTEGDLVDLATVGLLTADGLVVLDGPVEDDAGTVRRTGELLDGDWPEVGDLAAASVDTFDGDPQRALGLPFEVVAVDGVDGPLPAWRVVPDDRLDEGTWVVLVHGRGGRLSEGNRALALAHRLGLPTLTVSIRNDPDAPADPDGFGRYGEREWEDLQAAVDHLQRVEQADAYVLVGYSQGGSIVLGFLRRSPHADDAVAAALISPLVSLHATLVMQAQQRGIPDPVIPPLLVATRLVSSLRADMDFAEVEHLERVDELPADLPMLVTHGDADTTVPIEPSRELAAARPEQITYQEYPGTDHVREWNADRERFEADLESLLISSVPAMGD